MNTIKRLTALGLAAALLAAGAAAAENSPPEVSAAAWILTEAETGDVLAGENPDEPRLIASTTKIMTAMLALELCDLDKTVTVEPAWAGIEGSSMYLEPGQRLKVRELLYGLMLASGNDAAVALACIAAGGTEAFAALMNERAAALGCENTHFSNPNGLDAEDHYSCARDLAVITAEALRDPLFREIVSTPVKTVGENTYTNHNRLLTECPGVFGVKTGYTEAAGRTLVTCCERQGVTLICVTLSDPDDWADHAALYDWAFGLYETVTPVPGGAVWEIPVIGGEADRVTVRPEAPLTVTRRAGQDLTTVIRLPGFVYAEVRAGEPAGEAAVMEEGRELASVKLIYTEDVFRIENRRPTLLDRLRDLFGRGEREIYTLE